jgi:general secretion pathway protein G
MSNATPTREDGFTLIELMIVVVVLGILAGLVLMGVGSVKDDATQAKNQANEKACERAVAYAQTSATPYDTYADWLQDPITCP